MRYLANLAGTEYEIEVEERAHGASLVRIDGRQFEVDLRRTGESSFSVIVDHRSFELRVARDGEDLVVVSRDGLARLSLADGLRRAKNAAAPGAGQRARAEVKAMMPGRVVEVMVGPGDEVGAEQGVMIVEAMKMENELRTPRAGRVAEVRVARGETVEKGAVLVVIE